MHGLAGLSYLWLFPYQSLGLLPLCRVQQWFLAVCRGTSFKLCLTGKLPNSFSRTRITCHVGPFLRATCVTRSSGAISALFGHSLGSFVFSHAVLCFYGNVVSQPNYSFQR